MRSLRTLFVLALAALLGACSLLPTAPTPIGPVAPATPAASAPVEPPPPPPRVLKAPRLALALGGGAARGFAHIGAIQVLEEQGIKPDLVVGTSAGSLVAALYASGKN
ncbi:MAG: patatin-like phospholipase family protein, partial [Inhella sp.]|nr:patatin-like phospholipase family protein [Inhella sp.]